MQKLQEEFYSKERQLFKARLLLSAQLSYLKKVYIKVHLKQLYFTKQGLYKLEEEEKASSTIVIESPVALVYLLLLTDFFDPAFPKLLSYNTPKPSSLHS